LDFIPAKQHIFLIFRGKHCNPTFIVSDLLYFYHIFSFQEYFFSKRWIIFIVIRYTHFTSLLWSIFFGFSIKVTTVFVFLSLNFCSISVIIYFIKQIFKPVCLKGSIYSIRCFIFILSYNYWDFICSIQLRYIVLKTI